MGLRGPKPQSTALKVLRGNPGKRPLNKAEPVAMPGFPSMPSWLDREARSEWRRLKRLLPVGLVCKVDQSALALLCQAWSELVELYKARGDEDTDPKRASAMRSAFSRWYRLAGQFSLFPACRSGLVLPHIEESDPMQELLNRGRNRQAEPRSRRSRTGDAEKAAHVPKS